MPSGVQGGRHIIAVPTLAITQRRVRLFQEPMEVPVTAEGQRILHTGESIIGIIDLESGTRGDALRQVVRWAQLARVSDAPIAGLPASLAAAISVFLRAERIHNAINPVAMAADDRFPNGRLGPQALYQGLQAACLASLRPPTTCDDVMGLVHLDPGLAIQVNSALASRRRHDQRQGLAATMEAIRRDPGTAVDAHLVGELRAIIAEALVRNATGAQGAAQLRRWEQLLAQMSTFGQPPYPGRQRQLSHDSRRGYDPASGPPPPNRDDWPHRPP